MAQRTHTEEFYEVTDTNLEIPELNQALLKWQNVYNTIRPHQALGYSTPQQLLRKYQQNKRKGVRCHQLYGRVHELGIKTLRYYNIRYHIGSIIPYIQNHERKNICPMEKLSLNRSPEKFYEVITASFQILELNEALLKWEKVYNTIRPHQALGYRTPQQCLEQYWQNRRKGGKV